MSSERTGPRQLILLRHGESEWNKSNVFTGWADPGLSAVGEGEAASAAAVLAAAGLGDVDACFTSVLRRACATAFIVLRGLQREYVPLLHDWRLNERCYGALQGLNKAETAAKYGEEQVKLWRRSFATPPPALDVSDARHPRNDARYALWGVPPEALPAGESLADTAARALPCWEQRLAPALRARHSARVLVVAHGNSLRALAMHLRGLSEEQVMAFELPTGVPYVLELDDGLAVKRAYFLGDDAAVAARQAATAAQGKAQPSA